MNAVRPVKTRTAILVASLAVFISACASVESKRAPARIEIQDSVGFTITEEARISNDTRVDYDRALALLEQGQLDEGVRLLESVADAAPDLSAPRIDLGIAYERAGDLDAAEKNLKLALESNPDHPIALNELGIVHRKTGHFAEAKQDYEAALAVYPGYHYARRNLGVLCDLYLGDLDCALTQYEAYMKTVPGDEEVTVWIADIRNRLGQPEKGR
ncbi:MAG: tetratricopeptide repeat protein [Woeseiaceae bacterium]